MKSGVDDQPAGPEDGLREVAEEAVLVFKESHLSAEALGVEGPTLAVARVHGKAGRAQVGAEKIIITKLKVSMGIKIFFSDRTSCAPVGGGTWEPHPAP